MFRAIESYGRFASHGAEVSIQLKIFRPRILPASLFYLQWSTVADRYASAVHLGVASSWVLRWF
jgi:hypothetical protein